MKRYEYKLYDRSWGFKEVLTPLVTSQVRFTSQLNGWQGQMTVDLHAPFDYTGVTKSDIIKVWCFSDLFPSGLLIYSGFVSKRIPKYERWKTTLSLTVLGLASLLTGDTVTANYNADPATIITSIVNAYNSAHTGIDITLGTVETVWSNRNIEYSGTNSLEAIKQATDSTGKWLYIWPDGTVNFHNNVSLIRASIDGEIDSIIMDDDLEKVVNSVEVEWSTWVVTATDPTSIALYDMRKKRISKTELKDSTSAQNYANQYITKYAQPTPAISVTITDKFEVWIETIIPGMFINILNSNLSLNNLQILKVEYTQYSVKLDISSYNSFAQEVLW